MSPDGPPGLATPGRIRQLRGDDETRRRALASQLVTLRTGNP